jgi:hypothetical protein
MNNLSNGITRESQENQQEIITEISQRWIVLPNDFTLKYTDNVDLSSKRYGNSRSAAFKVFRGNSSGRVVLAHGVLETVRGNDRVPGHGEPLKLRGSMNSPEEQVRPSAGKDGEVKLKILNAYIKTNQANRSIL